MATKTKNDNQYKLPMDTIPINPPEPVQQVVVDYLGNKIEANLCGLYMTVKRPGARPMMREMKVEATTVDRDQAEVSKTKITRPCWKIDIHPLWEKLDKNAGLIEKTLTKYSVSASVKGEHLVSMMSIGNLLVELNALRVQRLALADEMAAKWETEVLPGLAAEFPQFYENQIKDRLPEASSLRDRFEVYWVIRPLTPMDNSNLNLSALSEKDAKEVIDRNKEFIHKLARQRFQTIFDEVFGQLMELCDQITTGEYTFGKRKTGAIEEILSMLERVNNFGAFADESILRHVDIATKTIKQYDLKQFNKSEMAQAAIKNAMQPLGQALKALTEQNIGGGRVARSVEI